MYIFLDIDGVLNKSSDWNKMYSLKDECIRCIQEFLVNVDNPQIVFSSTWRNGIESDGTLSAPIQELLDKIADSRIRTVDKTAIAPDGKRNKQLISRGEIMTEQLLELRRDTFYKLQMTDKDNDKQLVLEVFSQILDIASAAKNESWERVEAYVAELNDEIGWRKILGQAMELVMDGVAPETLTEIMANQYYATNPQGCNAMGWYLIIRGTLMVQKGDSARQTGLVLKSLLNESDFQGIEQIYIEAMEKEELYAKKNLQKFIKQEPLRTNSHLSVIMECIEEKLGEMSEEQVDILLSKTRLLDWVSIFPALQSKYRDKILGEIPENARQMLIEDCYFQGEVSDENLIEAAVKMAEIIKGGQ